MIYLSLSVLYFLITGFVQRGFYINILGVFTEKKPYSKTLDVMFTSR